MRDLKEFATVLNACGRLGNASVGIGACLGNEEMKQRAVKAMAAYRREISSAMSWYKNANGSVIRGKGYMIINAEDKVMPTIIGTLASIVSRSGEVKDGTLILSMAQMLSGKTKVSLRVGGSRGHGLNLRDIIAAIAGCVDGQAGGHHEAAGALFETSREAEFVEAAKRVLEAQSIEEKVC